MVLLQVLSFSHDTPPRKKIQHGCLTGCIFGLSSCCSDFFLNKSSWYWRKRCTSTVRIAWHYLLRGRYIAVLYDSPVSAMAFRRRRGFFFRWTLINTFILDMAGAVRFALGISLWGLHPLISLVEPNWVQLGGGVEGEHVDNRWVHTHLYQDSSSFSTFSWM